MWEVLRKNIFIVPPKLDGSDCDRYFTEMNRAIIENGVEARAFEKRISEQYIKPATRRARVGLWNTVKRLCSSAHECRWGDDNTYD
jgi:hypothetical protein